MTRSKYYAEFQRRVREFEERFATEYTAYDELLDAMAAIEHEMNHIGGGNWDEDYNGYLDTVGEHLLADDQFKAAEKEKIKRSLSEIRACGDELMREGSSSRGIDDAVDYLVARVVDWCRRRD